MTKIPSVEQEILRWMNAYIPEGKTVPVFEDMLEQYATTEREAGAREVLLSIQKIVAESRTVEEEHGIGNREATARAQVIADIQALTQPPCQP